MSMTAEELEHWVCPNCHTTSSYQIIERCWREYRHELDAGFVVLTDYRHDAGNDEYYVWCHSCGHTVPLEENSVRFDFTARDQRRSTPGRPGTLRKDQGP